MTAPATLTDLSHDRDLSLCGVPNKIAKIATLLCRIQKSEIMTERLLIPSD